MTETVDTPARSGDSAMVRHNRHRVESGYARHYALPPRTLPPKSFKIAAQKRDAGGPTLQWRTQNAPLGVSSNAQKSGLATEQSRMSLKTRVENS